MPDLEAVCARTLRDVGGMRAYSSIPSEPEWPLVVVRRLGGVPAVREKLDAAFIQFDVWGGAKGDPPPQVSKSDVQQLADQARVLIFELEGMAFHYDPHHVFVSGVEDAGGMHWLPDPQTGRDRYEFSLRVYGSTSRLES